MATYLTHLRVAEKIKKRIKDVDLDYLMVGSIAPDSGAKEITHFYKKKNGQQLIDIKCFYNRHLRPEILFQRSDKTRSFYWGYYFHLIVDNLWNEKVYNHINNKFKNDDNITFLLKQELVTLDFKYLCENDDNNIFTKFRDVKVNLEFFNDFPPKLIYDNIEKIKNYYGNKNVKIKDKFDYIEEKSLEEFIDTAVKESIDAFYK